MMRNRKFLNELSKRPRYKKIVFYIPPLESVYAPVDNPKEWLESSERIYVPLESAGRGGAPVSKSDIIYRYNERIKNRLARVDELEEKSEVNEREQQEQRERLSRAARRRRNEGD
jgi:hypothetical protein